MSNRDDNDMNYEFSAKVARNKLISKLKEKGETDENIKKIMDICDKDYVEKRYTVSKNLIIFYFRQNSTTKVEKK
ncbi:MAG: hypothetical protein BHW01_01990 [Clostridium sp. 27_14]|nr:MAG: hypothetical protein BHW01_01990 [Clostridium sp. 27_14]